MNITTELCAAAFKLPPAECTRAEEERFIFILMEGFTLLAFSGAVETLRVANHVAGKELYRWEIQSQDGQSVLCSAGIALPVDSPLQIRSQRERYVFVGGLLQEVPPKPSKELLAWARRIHTHGGRLVALCTATRLLAAAGILARQECAIHWEYADPFAETFPSLKVASSAYTLGAVPTTVGGVASVELFLRLIGEKHGAVFASRVADSMLLRTVREVGEEQTASAQTRLGLRNPILSRVINLIEQNIESPLTMGEIAGIAGLSVRQVERLFLRHVGLSPMKYYRRMRLDRARRLLSMTDMSVTEVAFATGHESASHFSKQYRHEFGTSPHQHRVVPGE